MPFLYGKADEKFVKSQSGTEKRKLKPMDTFKFHLNLEPNENQKIKFFEDSIILRATPEKLTEICGSVVNAMALPSPFLWSVLQVSDWIRRLGFPQYQNTFKKNHINGRTLLSLDVLQLIKMNITDFDHLRFIANTIRKLYGFESTAFKRSISMPERSLDNIYKLYHTKTGPKYDTIRRTDLGKINHLLRPRSLNETHWQSLERWLKHKDHIEKELVGNISGNKNTMFIPRKGRPKSVGQKKSLSDCSGMPPCTCGWTKDNDLREPWKLKCLKNKMHERISAEDFECEKCDYDKGFTLLREYLPQKYGTTEKIRMPNK